MSTTMDATGARVRRETEYVLNILRELERNPNVSRHELADKLATGETRMNRYLDRLINAKSVPLVTESAFRLRTEVKGPVAAKIAERIVRERYAYKAEVRAWRRERAHSLRLRTRLGRSAYSDFRRYYVLTRDKEIQQIKAAKTRRMAMLQKDSTKMPTRVVLAKSREHVSNSRKEIGDAKEKCRKQKRWARARIAEVERFERLFSLFMATVSDKQAKRARQRLLRECMELWVRIEESAVLTRWTAVRRYLEAKEARRRYFAFKRAEFQKHARIIKGLLKSSQTRSPEAASSQP